VSVLLRLANRNLWRHPWRTLATVLGVATGIAAVLATLSTGDNVQANLRAMLEAAAGKANLIVTPGAEGRAVFEIDDAFGSVTADPAVSRAYPVLNFRAEPLRDLAPDSGAVVPSAVDSGFQLSGRILDVPDDLPVALAEGRLPQAGAREIAVPREFAQQRGMTTGDTLRFATQFGIQPLRLSGLLDDAVGFASTNGGRVGIVPLADLQEILRLGGRASFLELILVPGSNSGVVQERLQDALGESFAVSTPQGVGNVTTGALEAIQAGLSILAVTLMALAGFLAYNTFNATVVERTREYALLRTICLTRAQVQRLALLEAGMLSLAGVLLGILLGVALSFVLAAANAVSLGIELRTLVVPVRSVLAAGALGVVMSLLAGYLPARAASATPPLTALRRVDEQEPPARLVLPGWLLLLVASAVALYPWSGPVALAATAVAMGLLFLGLTLVTGALLRPALAVLGPVLQRIFGTAGRLGAGMTLRNSVRNGVAIGMVVVGTALTIGVGSMVAGLNGTISDWIDTTIIGDLFVTSPVAFPDAFAESAAAAVPGLDVVSGVGLNVVRFEPEGGGRARSIALVMVDPERFAPDEGFGSFQFLDGQGDQPTAYEALREGHKVLIAGTMMERFGLRQGDFISLRTVAGFRDFEVAGVIVDFTSGGESAVVSIHDMPLFGGGNPDLFVMTVKPGVDAETARSELLAAFPDLFLDVTLNQAYRERILEQADQMFATTNLLLILAVFIATLGVANTLGMNLSTRQHEIAVLRTLGVTRTGIRKMVTAESLTVVIIGAVAGVLCGLLLSRVITAGASALSGFQLSPRYPWSLIAGALLFAPAVGLLAALFPARRAARLSPVRALAAEE
jgi:putative ABC transport system permease protein